ncbi:Ser/Thr protein kinase RdoA (MazF antagonist) [Chitinivorax tropicus]|uniref:Stress response kinase A n=1 Tax=Chitinivorax tropicus TaxID=714531 RepID=A0A840MLN9_9PROT|nr:serine/threonine protein kinase [Chitinivorax tropicus]MBB5018405.1 Ser/Thr protein kinase RdoA (MazF antagonist) [Chitinivorax tropicus]
MNTAPPYAELTPDVMLDAIDATGHRCDGRLLALNSYENRVYQVGQEDGPPLIAKFYRPARWSDEAILEEHAFSSALAEAEIPVIAPLTVAGISLFQHAGFRFAVFPRRSGRTPELDDDTTLEWIGRFMGRIHALGACASFQHRPTLNIEQFAILPSRFLLEHDFIPVELRPAYQALAEQLIEKLQARWTLAGDYQPIRLHGDCHPGNLLWTDAGPHFVDFDDARMGPAIQDLWMLLSGDRHSQQRQLGVIVDEYSAFHELDERELWLIEPLRTLRIMHYASWLAQRWDDPAFPNAFPWFNSQRYWEEHILTLREQLATLDDPPLVI